MEGMTIIEENIFFELQGPGDEIVTYNPPVQQKRVGDIVHVRIGEILGHLS